MKYKKITFKSMLVLLIAIALLFLPTGEQRVSATADQEKHFIFFVVDQVGLNNLNDPDLLNFKQVIEQGAIGLMNTSTGGAQTVNNSFITIGSSSRALGGSAASQAFNAEDEVSEVSDEKVINIYLRRNNDLKISSDNIISLTVEQFKRLNENMRYTVEVGALGEALHQAGIKTCVIGNSDRPAEDNIFPKYIFGRQAVTMLMDSRGIVDCGDISEATNLADYTAPFGIRANEEEILRLFNQFYDHSQVLLINFGDTYRADIYASVLGKENAEEQRKAALLRADYLLGQILQKIDLDKDCLAVVVPTPSITNKKDKNTMTPAIIVGGGMQAGLLTSSTTHRQGIMTNIDLAPTVLAFFQLNQHESMIGAPAFGEKFISGNKMQYLEKLEADLVNNTVRRVPILKSVAYYTAVILIMALVLMVLRLFNLDVSTIFKQLLFYNFLAVLTLPLALLIMGILKVPDVNLSFVYLILLVIGLTIIMNVLCQRCNIHMAIIFICFSFLGLLFFDLFTGAEYILRSPLGYDPQRGARFYGIGNELMGAAIGAATLGFAAFLDIKRFKGQIALVGVLMLSILLIMVFPGLGSKAGASISVTAAFVTLIWLSLGYATGKKQLLTVSAAILAVLVLISVADSIGVPRTHVGRAIADIQSEGLSSALDIIVRKLEMDFKLMRYSYWSGILMASIFLMLLMFKFRLDFIEHLQRNTPNILNGCYAGLFGAAVALFTNDAGIVAAATAVIYPIFCLLLFNLLDKTKSSTSG